MYPGGLDKGAVGKVGGTGVRLCAAAGEHRNAAGDAPGQASAAQTAGADTTDAVLRPDGHHLSDAAVQIRKDAHPELPAGAQPQGDVAAAGLEQWDKMSLPIPGFAEQVFYHQIPADSDGMMNISLVNPDEKLKLTVSCRRKELPYFVEWKQMGQGEYVLGLEPANCLPENQNNNRAKNTLKTIKPGEIIRLKVMVTIEKFC
jgi:galactose mutarotase-like enzyme